MQSFSNKRKKTNILFCLSFIDTKIVSRLVSAGVRGFEEEPAESPKVPGSILSGVKRAGSGGTNP